MVEEEKKIEEDLYFSLDNYAVVIKNGEKTRGNRRKLKAFTTTRIK